MAYSTKDREYMLTALELAAKGFAGRGVRPNPVVGCVIVKKGVIVGRGFHKKFGGAHAEVNALRDAGSRARGADVYVTLDPCRHVGKTGPCTDALVRAGVKRVISAMDDPHDVRHEGEKILKRADIGFSRGLLVEEARLLNQVYLKNVLCELPYVTLKVATTLDGKIATATGVSRGITGDASLKEVHRMRASVDAILTGSGTALIDNPHLGVRYAKGADPLRVLLDSSLVTAADALIFRDANCIVFTTKAAHSARVARLRAKRVEVVIMPSGTGRPSGPSGESADSEFGNSESLELLPILKELFERGAYSLMIESGSTLMTGFLREGLVDRYVQFIAPKLLGGENSRTSFEGVNPVDLSGVLQLEHVEYIRFGDDMRVEGVVKIH